MTAAGRRLPCESIRRAGLPQAVKVPLFINFGNGRNLDDDSHSTTVHAGDRIGQGACRRRRLELSRSRSRLLGLLRRLDLAKPRSVFKWPQPDPAVPGRKVATGTGLSVG